MFKQSYYSLGSSQFHIPATFALITRGYGIVIYELGHKNQINLNILHDGLMIGLSYQIAESISRLLWLNACYKKSTQNPLGIGV